MCSFTRAMLTLYATGEWKEREGRREGGINGESEGQLQRRDVD